MPINVTGRVTTKKRPRNVARPFQFQAWQFKLLYSAGASPSAAGSPLSPASSSLESAAKLGEISGPDSPRPPLRFWGAAGRRARRAIDRRQMAESLENRLLLTVTFDFNYTDPAGTGFNAAGATQGTHGHARSYDAVPISVAAASIYVPCVSPDRVLPSRRRLPPDLGNEL